MKTLVKATETVVAPSPPPGIDLWTPITGIIDLPDGSILVHTVTTSETQDAEGEIADYEPMKAAITEFMLSGANLREMHDAKTAAGTVLKTTFDDVARRSESDLHVVDPIAVRKVKANVYKGVSWHGLKWVTPWMTTATGKARHIVRALIDELSLADRPANPDALLAKQHRQVYVLAKRKESPVAAQPTAVAEAAPQKYVGEDGQPMTAEPLAKVDPPKKVAPVVAPVDKKALRKSAKFAKAQIATAKLEKKAARLAKKKIKPEDAHAALDAVGAAHDAASGAIGEAHDAIDAAAGPDDEADDAAKTAAKTAAKARKAQARELRKSARAARKTIRMARLAKTIRRAARKSKSLAKVGARNSSGDASIIDSIHDSAVALGSMKCMGKATGTVLDPSIAVNTGGATNDTGPAVAPGATMAKSADVTFDNFIERIRTDISVPLAKELNSAKAEILGDLGARLAKVEKMPAGGGPLTAPSRGGAGDMNEEAILAKAAERFPIGSTEREALGKVTAQAGIAAIQQGNPPR